MQLLPTLNRTPMIISYGAAVLVVHISTNGFQTKAPILYVTPMMLLVFMTLCTKMVWRKKAAMIGSFLTIAYGIYYWALLPKHLVSRSVSFCASHILYLSTFVMHIRHVWTNLAVAMVLYSFGLLIYVVGDLYRSIPVVVLALASDLLTISTSIVAAGSLWRNGVKGSGRYEANTAALLRFIGVGVELVSASVLMFNHFLNHGNFHNYMLLYYIAQFLLFIANEQMF